MKNPKIKVLFEIKCESFEMQYNDLSTTYLISCFKRFLLGCCKIPSKVISNTKSQKIYTHCHILLQKDIQLQVCKTRI